MGLFAPIRDYIGSLVHPSAQFDALTAARHRAFIAPRLLGSIVALTCFPIYLLARGTLSLVELMVFAWLVLPILTAYFLSRTGRYESAHILSSLALIGLVMMVAVATGGISSFAAIWLVIVPLEASLSASRRVVAIASTLALLAAGLLVFFDARQLLPAQSLISNSSLSALGIVSATLYATGLALGAEALAKTSFWLFYAEEDRYRLLARNMTDTITRHGRDGAVLFASPAGERLFGARIAELQGHGLFDRVHVVDRPAYLTALGDAAAFGETRSVEFRVRRDGVDENGAAVVDFVWIEMRCRPLDRALLHADQHGNREVVAVSRDITPRKQQQQALEQARAEAEQANVAKGRFLATMSHELRTPLNAILGFSDMLKKEELLRLDSARRHEYATLINDSGNHLLAVVNGILDMSKIEAGHFEITPESFKPSQVVTGCCDMLALRARDAGVTLEKCVGDGLPEIVADKRSLNQILLNLISNAIRFTERGGKVTVSARAEATTMTFVVEDSGIGISEENLARVGEPYFQAGSSYDRRQGGTGLGLSIVKGLVRLHGGEISIRSRVGEGTRVIVSLPLDCERTRHMQRRNDLATVTALNTASQRSSGTPDREFSVHDNGAIKKSA